jgi:hypothetical protein
LINLAIIFACYAASTFQEGLKYLAIGIELQFMLTSNFLLFKCFFPKKWTEYVDSSVGLAQSAYGMGSHLSEEILA